MSGQEALSPRQLCEGVTNLLGLEGNYPTGSVLHAAKHGAFLAIEALVDPNSVFNVDEAGQRTMRELVRQVIDRANTVWPEEAS